ncbi:MAG: hypothetical protein RDV41_04800 [Planctomycetota bacterium]|nr:hypothetical protein [Planctomycetota bacterium]
MRSPLIAVLRIVLISALALAVAVAGAGCKSRPNYTENPDRYVERAGLLLYVDPDTSAWSLMSVPDAPTKSAELLGVSFLTDRAERETRFRVGSTRRVSPHALEVVLHAGDAFPELTVLFTLLEAPRRLELTGTFANPHDSAVTTASVRLEAFGPGRGLVFPDPTDGIESLFVSIEPHLRLSPETISRSRRQTTYGIMLAWNRVAVDDAAVISAMGSDTVSVAARTSASVAMTFLPTVHREAAFTFVPRGIAEYEPRSIQLAAECALPRLTLAPGEATPVGAAFPRLVVMIGEEPDALLQQMAVVRRQHAPPATNAQPTDRVPETKGMENRSGGLSWCWSAVPCEHFTETDILRSAAVLKTICTDSGGQGLHPAVEIGPGCEDVQADTRRFTNGLSGLTSRIESLGVEPRAWFDPFAVAAAWETTLTSPTSVSKCARHANLSRLIARPDGDACPFCWDRSWLLKGADGQPLTLFDFATCAHVMTHAAHPDPAGVASAAQTGDRQAAREAKRFHVLDPRIPGVRDRAAAFAQALVAGCGCANVRFDLRLFSEGCFALSKHDPVATATLLQNGLETLDGIVERLVPRRPLLTAFCPCGQLRGHDHYDAHYEVGPSRRGVAGDEAIPLDDRLQTLLYGSLAFPGETIDVMLSLEDPITCGEAAIATSVVRMVGCGILLTGDLAGLVPEKLAVLRGLLAGESIRGARPVRAFPQRALEAPILAPLAADTRLAPVRLQSWEFRIGDDLAWAKDAKASTQWQPTTVPCFWEYSGMPGNAERSEPPRSRGYWPYDGFAWYRATVVVPESVQGLPVSLELGRIADADSVYCNGRRLGQTGGFPPEHSPTTDAFRRYVIKPDMRLLKSGEKNTFHVRVFDGGDEGGLYSLVPRRVPDVWVLPQTDTEPATRGVVVMNAESYPREISLPAGVLDRAENRPVSVRTLFGSGALKADGGQTIALQMGSQSIVLVKQEVGR